MSPDRAQDRPHVLSQGLFGAPPGWRNRDRPDPREPGRKHPGADGSGNIPG